MQTFVDKVIMYQDRAEVFLNFFPNFTIDFEMNTTDTSAQKTKKEHFR